MRVIAGEAKGRRLKAPKGKRVRPTSDYLREALFGILGSSVRGVRFLDLYAGWGAVGIEALSRGGAEVVFLEQDPACLRVLRENVERTGLGQNRLLGGDVLRVLPRLARQREGFDLTFLRPHGVVIVEHFAKEPLPERIGNLRRIRERTHGQTMLSFYARAPEVEQ